MRRRMALLGLALLVGGCAQTYDKPGVSEAEFRRDSYECEHDAASLPRTPQSIAVDRQGYTRASDPSFGWADILAGQSLFDRCMEARGYRRVP